MLSELWLKLTSTGTCASVEIIICDFVLFPKISNKAKRKEKKMILVSYCPRCEVPPFWLHCTLIISAVVVLGMEGTDSAVHAQCTAGVSLALIIPHTALDSLQCVVDTGWHSSGFHLCSDPHKLNAARSSPLWTYIRIWIPTVDR